MPSDTHSSETRERFRDTPLWKGWMEEVRLWQVTSIAELDEFLERGALSPVVSWDIETESLDANPETTVGHCLAFSPDEAVYIPVRHREGKEQNLDPTEVLDRILPVLRSKRLLVYNYKFEGQFLRYLPKSVWEWRNTKFDQVCDVYILAWLVESNEKQLGLKTTTRRKLKSKKGEPIEMLEIHEVPGAARNKRTGKAQKNFEIDFSYTHPEDATLYAAADPVFTLRLFNLLEPEILKKTEEFPMGQRFIADVEHRLLDVLFWIEDNPVMLDRQFLTRSLRDLDRWVALVSGRIFAGLGGDVRVNLDSPAEVGKLLDSRGVKLGRTATGQIATNADEIERAIEEQGEHFPFLKDIGLRRSLLKERSTYVDVLLESSERGGGAVRPRFRSVGAPTGRLASGGVARGDSRYTPMNFQSVPSASSYEKTYAWKVRSNPEAEVELEAGATHTRRLTEAALAPPPPPQDDTELPLWGPVDARD